jgi:hypothetical protein
VAVLTKVVNLVPVSVWTSGKKNLGVGSYWCIVQGLNVFKNIYFLLTTINTKKHLLDVLSQISDGYDDEESKIPKNSLLMIFFKIYKILIMDIISFHDKLTLGIM